MQYTTSTEFTKLKALTLMIYIMNQGSKRTSKLSQRIGSDTICVIMHFRMKKTAGEFTTIFEYFHLQVTWSLDAREQLDDAHCYVTAQEKV